MFIGKVKARVVATVKHPSYVGRKILLVRQINPRTGEEYGEPVVAVDFVDAGVGDTVLVSQEGGSARRVLGDKSAPVRSFIVGIVEDWEMAEE
ncbi:MAG TPA: hypothetical protein ENG11_01985 [candidate division Zixibacteria bacterium]|nr:hypothetical protein [candidate division Zixibacteria bacterium]